MFLHTADCPIHKVSRGCMRPGSIPAKIILCNTFLCIMCIIRQHRQDRSEDFFSHHGIRPVHIRHHCGSNPQSLFVILPAADGLFRIHQPKQSVKMLFVDDFSIIRILQGIFSKLPRDLLSDSFHQLIPDLAIAQNIIRCHAGLPAIQIFSEHDPPGRQRDLCRSIHDAGAFPTQLQRHRGQVFRGTSQHLPSHDLASGEKYHIKPLLQ